MGQNADFGSSGSGSDGSGSHGPGSGRFRFQTVPIQDGSGSRRFGGTQTVPLVPVPTVPVHGSIHGLTASVIKNTKGSLMFS